MGGYLGESEINVIRGALDLTGKQATVAMTPLDKVDLHRLMHSDMAIENGDILDLFDLQSLRKTSAVSLRCGQDMFCFFLI